ncbi:MAG TPA: ABC transporter ATP-binding protein [Candidatus Limnocylindrales bacterium]|nr:ABC transporter ATP-binding protein [Candidatus Limnocylindrales bacterium]
MSAVPVLQADNLSLDYRLGVGWVNAVCGVTLSVGAGEIHGLVGESGSGKSTVALALMGFLAPNARASSGRVLLDGEDLLALDPAALRDCWGTKVSLVPQDALASLNPSYKIGDQIAEVLQTHEGVTRTEAWQRAIAMLEEVRIANPPAVARKYPHQLSGGMQQRVMIAMALIARPRLLILDEPTTALDVTTQAAIIALIRDLVREEGAAAIYVSHDLALVAQLCDQITVLYGGEVMESAVTPQISRQALHPYTISLLASLPRLRTDPGARLPTIPGSAPSLTARPAACVFSDRCPAALDKCRTEKPPDETSPDGRLIKCWRWQEIAAGTLAIDQAPVVNHSAPASSNVPLLTARHLKKRFGEHSLWARLRGRAADGVHALDDVSVTVASQTTVGVVGESGSGKTTLARVIIGLETPDSGTLELLGATIAPSVGQRPQAVRRQMQMIFQNPADSLNPYITVGAALERTVRRFDNALTREQARQRVNELLESVRLTTDYANRYPAELSGGERQRVGIARAFAANPALILADEPTSALDVSVQAAVLNLLKDLRAEQGAAYLFISHDLRAISYLADLILVMVHGAVVEEATSEQFTAAPFHPYTELLLASLPDPSAPRSALELAENEVEADVVDGRGCPFAGRCPRKLGPICDEQAPPWRTTDEGHRILCHIPLDELRALQTTPGAAL